MTALLSRPALESWAATAGRAVVAARSLPLVLALRGPLGAGKSVLARALARGAGVTSHMPSPTYNMLFTYSGLESVEVHHMDLYRLDDPEDVWELGWEELGVGAQVVLIEWPERAESLLMPDRWDVELEFVATGAAGDAAGEAAEDAAEEAAGGHAAEQESGSEAGFRRVHLTRRGRAPDLPPLPGPAS